MTPCLLPYHGWIDIVLDSNDPDHTSQVFGPFSPNGVLLSSIFSVDRLGLMKFEFPNERLLEWAYFMLANAKDGRVLVELCSLFRGRVKEDSILLC
ncbi:hypothetical protein NL676_030101 [Syzygium grande]|nr:hypothetical protein NL676_030101 [Syzygium grande]